MHAVFEIPVTNTPGIQAAVGCAGFACQIWLMVCKGTPAGCISHVGQPPPAPPIPPVPVVAPPADPPIPPVPVVVPPPLPPADEELALDELADETVSLELEGPDVEPLVGVSL